MARVLIAGAGPAGAALALLLAERGVEVVLIERQNDFSREFRGEVLMPSGLQALSEIGVSREFEAVPRKRPPQIQLHISRRVVFDAEIDPEVFEGYAPEAVSQTHLLEMLVARAAKGPHFTLLRGASVKDLLIEDGRVVGLRVRMDQGTKELRGDLIVGADGRASVVRRKAQFDARAHELPMDIVWFKIPRPDWLRGVRAYVGRGHLLISYQTWDDTLQVVPILSRPDPNPNDVDAATAAIEAERMPEVRTIQRLQALPPKLVMSTSPMGAAGRYVAARILGSGIGQRRGLAGLRIFLFGASYVRLQV